MTNELDEPTYRQQLAWMRERFVAREYGAGHELAVIEMTASRLDEAVRLLEAWGDKYRDDWTCSQDTDAFLARVRP